MLSVSSVLYESKTTTSSLQETESRHCGKSCCSFFVRITIDIGTYMRSRESALQLGQTGRILSSFRGSITGEHLPIMSDKARRSHVPVMLASGPPRLLRHRLNFIRTARQETTKRRQILHAAIEPLQTTRHAMRDESIQW